jgi:hypothetical protein
MLGWEILGYGFGLYFGVMILREGVKRYAFLWRKD